MPVRLLRDELRDLYARYLGELEAQVVVDVGTGFGENLRALVGASGGSAYVVTLDIDPLALQKARTLFAQAYGGLDLVCADAHYPPLRRGSVRLVAAVATLHHLADLRAFLENFREVMADNGVFIALDWTPGSRLTPHPPEEHEKVLDSFRRLFPEFFRLEDLRVYKDYFIVVGSKP